MFFSLSYVVLRWVLQLTALPVRSNDYIDAAADESVDWSTVGPTTVVWGNLSP